MANVPPLIQAAVGMAGVSLVVFLAGYSSNYWFVSSSRGFHFGLWAICTSLRCYTYNRYLNSTPAHAYVGRFCASCQLICVIVGLVLVSLFAFKSARQNWAKGGYSALLAAGIVGFLGAVIFIGREKSLDTGGVASVSWGGVLVVFAAIMQIVSAILVIMPIRRGQVEFEQA